MCSLIIKDCFLSNVWQNVTTMAVPGTDFENFLRPERLEEYKKIKCGHCKKMLTNPVQILSCSHSLCKGCVETLLFQAQANERVAQCPYENCDEQLVGKQSYTESLNRLAEVNQLLSSTMNCDVSDDCNWKGLFRDYEDHVNESHPMIIVREVANTNSTHTLSKEGGTMNVQIVASIVSFDSGIASPSTKSFDQPTRFSAPPELKNMLYNQVELRDEVRCESVATPESKNRKEENSEMVLGKLAYPPLQYDNQSLNRETAVSQQNSPPTVREDKSPLRRSKQKVSTHKQLARRESLSPMQLRSSKMHSKSHRRTPSLPPIASPSHVENSDSIAGVLTTETNLHQPYKLLRRRSLTLDPSHSLPPLSSAKPRQLRRTGSAKPVIGLSSLSQRPALRPIGNNSLTSQTVPTPDASNFPALAASRCTGVECMLNIALIQEHRKLIRQKDEELKEKVSEIKKLQFQIERVGRT